MDNCASLNKPTLSGRIAELQTSLSYARDIQGKAALLLDALDGPRPIGAGAKDCATRPCGLLADLGDVSQGLEVTLCGLDSLLDSIASHIVIATKGTLTGAVGCSAEAAFQNARYR